MPTGDHDDAALVRRHAASRRAFYRSLAGGSVGARLIERPGVRALAVPLRPHQAVFNTVFEYDDADALEPALPGLHEAYASVGVRAWSVVVPLADVDAAAALAAGGLHPASTLIRMAAWIGPLDLRPRVGLRLITHPSWEMIARCNDRSYGVPPHRGIGELLLALRDERFHLYAVAGSSSRGEAVASIVSREQDGDCYLWFLATVPEARGTGIAIELARHALREAQARGCETASGEATPAASRLYAALGARSLGRLQLWERSLASASSTTSETRRAPS